MTGKQPEGVTGVAPAEDGWIVAVEVVEDRRIPSSSDILASYEAGLDMTGNYCPTAAPDATRADGATGESDRTGSRAPRVRRT